MSKWDQMAHHVLEELKRLNKSHDEFRDMFREHLESDAKSYERIAVEIAKLKIRSGYVAVFAGSLPSLIVGLFFLVKYLK